MAKKPITKEEILEIVLKGMDPYISCGVPEAYWKLARRLIQEIYGSRGVKLLEKYHKAHDGSVSANHEIIEHSVHGWLDPNTEVTPDELLQMLYDLNDDIRFVAARKAQRARKKNA